MKMYFVFIVKIIFIDKPYQTTNLGKIAHATVLSFSKINGVLLGLKCRKVVLQTSRTKWESNKGRQSTAPGYTLILK